LALAVGAAMAAGLVIAPVAVPPAAATGGTATLSDTTGGTTTAMLGGDALQTTWSSFSPPTGNTTLSGYFCSTATPPTDAAGFAAACPHEAFTTIPPSVISGSFDFTFQPADHGQPCATGTSCDLVYVDSAGDVAPFNIEFSLTVGAATASPVVHASQTDLQPGQSYDVNWSGFDLLAGSTAIDGYYCNTATPSVTAGGPSTTDCPGAGVLHSAPSASTGSVASVGVPSPAVAPCLAGATCWLALFDGVSGVNIQFDASVQLTIASSPPQTLLDDTFTHPTTSAPLVIPTGTPGFPCLTAGTDPNATPVPGCDLSPPDADGSGVLRLTDNAYGQAAGLVHSSGLPSTDGLAITFKQYQYSNGAGNDGDGINFFLAVAQPYPSTIGPPGGHLGYSAEPSPGAQGLPGGYLGIGFDVYGNYGRTSYDGANCVDFSGAGDAGLPNQVSVRGPGNGYDGYCLLSQSTNLPFSLLGTNRADAARSVQIIVDTQAKTYTVSMDPAGGTNYQTVTSGQLPASYIDPATFATVPGIPPRLTYGFAASTGAASDFHEITNVHATTLAGGALPTLGLTKTDGTETGTVVAGSVFDYLLNPSIAAGADETQASTLVLTDPLPAGVTLADPPTEQGSPTQWDCSADTTTTVSCKYIGGPTITQGTALDSLHLDVQLSATAPGGPLVNTASMVSDDAVQTVTASDTVTVTPANSGSPNLALTKTDSVNGAATAGQSFSYTLVPSVAEGGDETQASSISVTDPLPPYVSVIGTVQESGGNNQWDCSASTSTNVNCAYTGGSTVPQGTTLDSIVVPVAVDPQAPAGALLNTATIQSNDADPITANDTVTVSASAAPQLTVTGPGGNTVPAGGSVIDFASLDTEALIKSAPLHSSPLHSSPLHSSPLHSSTLLSSLLYSSPLHSSPLHSSPLHSSPLHSSPLHSSPLHSSMLYSEQLAGAPLHSSPLHSSPLHSSTLAPISLSTIPLHSSSDPALTWTDVLAGTPFAGKPLQDVTLLDVLNYDETTPIPLFDSLSMADVDFSTTPLAHVGLAALLLAQVPIHYLAPPAGQLDANGQPITDPDAAWCAYLASQPVNCSTPGWDNQAVTLLTLELAQDDLSAYYSSPISMLPPATQLSGSTDLPIVDSADNPVGSGDLSFSATIADFPLSAFNLGATPLNGFQVTNEQTVGDLINDVAAGKVLGVTSLSLQDLVPGLISDASQFDFTGAPFDELLAASPVSTTNLATYQLSFVQSCTSAAGLTANINLPAEFRYVPGTATLNVNSAGASPTADPLLLGQDVRFTGLSLGGACPSANPVSVVISFGAEPSGLLGPSLATASVDSLNQQGALSNPAAITVIEGQGSSNPDAPTALTTDALYSGYLTTPGQPQYWTVPAPPPGTRVDVTLSSLPQDYDLVTYGPPGANPSVALRAATAQTTPSVSSPIPDNSPQIAGTALAPPQTLQDVPLLANLPLLTYSTNRGTAPESLTITGQSGVVGDIVIQVSGFNGATSTQPYVLRAETIAGPSPLPCRSQQFPFAGQGATADPLPSAPLDSTTETLILVNEKRMGDLYGSASTSVMLSKLHNFAAQPNVHGVIVPVEAKPAVAAAYNTWDSNSCSVASADGVVRAINDLVDTLRPGLTNLRFIDIIGSDAAIPQARLQDLASISNEQDYADQDRFGGFDNAISSAQLDGYMLSDDPYGAFSPKPFLGSELYAPDVALGRIVESSDQVSNALDQYDNNSNGGQLDPTTAAVSGYDFMTNGASQIAANLKSSSVSLSPFENLLIGPLWRGTDALSAITTVGATNGYASINGHYNNYQGEPADMFYGAPNDVFTAAQLQAEVPSLAGSLLFTMGCHAGLNLPDVMVSSPGQADATVLADWAETVTGLGGLYDANTGFGYGDNLILAYSEKLMSYYAANLSAGNMSVAQAMQFAKDRYVGEAGAFGAYDNKAVAEATFYGIPNYAIGNGGVATPPAPAAPTPGRTASSISVNPAFTTVTPDSTSPSYQDANDPTTGQPQPPQVMNLRPTEPKLALDETPSDGDFLHGFYITGLASNDNGPIPPIDAPTIDSSNETAPNFSGVFPSAIQGVSSANTPSGQKQYLNLILGQLFVDPSVNNGSPTERNFTHVGGSLYRSDSNSFTPPSFDSIDAVVSGSSVTFTATTSSPSVTNANVLYRDDLDSSWQELDLGGSGTTFSATVGLRVGATRITEYFGQLLDSAGNVGVTSDKGFGYQSNPAPPPPDAPALNASFTPSSVVAGATTTLALSLSNPNSDALAGTAVTNTPLPLGLTVAATPNLINTCGGTATATSAGISLSGGSIAGNGSCTITVDTVAPDAPGTVTLTTGVPIAAGTSPGVATTTDLTVSSQPAVVLAPTSIPEATAGTRYSQLVTTTGTAPVTFGSTGNLDGLTVAAVTCSSGIPASVVGCATIAGTPVGPGVFSFTVTATDHNDTLGAQTYQLTVNGVAPAISGTPPGAAGTALVVGRAIAPFTFHVTGAPAPTLQRSGTLPPGLTFNLATGVLSGTPTAAGKFTATVSASNGVTDANDIPLVASDTFTVVVNGPLTGVTGVPPSSANVGVAYPFQFAAQGTPAATSFSVTIPATLPAGATGGLPPGLTLDNSGGISGTPTTPGTYAAQVSASNGISPPATGALFTITVKPSVIAITVPSLTPATVGTAYGPFTYTTSPPAIAWSVTALATQPPGTKPGLPPGLSISSGGVLGGTPTADPIGPYTYAGNITATDSYGDVVSAPFSIVVAAAPTVLTGTPPTGTVATPYGPFSFTAPGAYPPPTFTITSGTLPAGLTLATSGAIIGTPTAAGLTTGLVVKAANSAGSKSLTFSIEIDGPPTVVNGVPPVGKVGAPYGPFSFTAPGAYPASTFTVTSGTLPAGLTLATSGAITGTPTAAGLSTGLVVTATNSAGKATQSFSIEIDGPPTVVNGVPPVGKVGKLYGPFSFTAAGAYPPPTFTVTSGTLPAGLTLATSGAITGTPTAAGLTTGLVVKAANSGGSKSLTFSIEIDGPPTTITGTPPAGVAGTAYGPFHFTADGYPTPTFAITTGTLPAGLSLNSATGAITGTPSTAGLTTGLVVTASNAKGSKTLTFSILVAGVAPVFTAESPPATGTLGHAYSYPFAATGIPAPTFAVSSGLLPPGLSLSAAGMLTGSPTDTGVFKFVVTATNSAGATASPTLTITVAAGKDYVVVKVTGTNQSVLYANSGFLTSGDFKVTKNTSPPGPVVISTGPPTIPGVSHGSAKIFITNVYVPLVHAWVENVTINDGSFEDSRTGSSPGGTATQPTANSATDSLKSDGQTVTWTVYDNG
jgi:hypothetical protein